MEIAVTNARLEMTLIHTISQGFGKYQKGEDVIVHTYPDADKAVKAILKSVNITETQK